MFRDIAYCVRSRRESWCAGLQSCFNESCDRYADDTVKRLAAKAGQPIGWADLKTSKCGFVPREESK